MVDSQEEVKANLITFSEGYCPFFKKMDGLYEIRLFWRLP